MKTIKKSLSLLLSAVMILSMFTGINISTSAANIDDLSYKIIDGKVTITGCDESASGELVIPNTIEGYPVTEIGGYAFMDCESLTNITIPDSVIQISFYAFAGCESLTDITIPDSVKVIGFGAFNGCESLTNITIPDSVKVINYAMFVGCKSLTNITIPIGVTSIGGSAFSYCESLANITIPADVKSIDDSAFKGCKSITDVYYSGTEAQWNNILIGSDNDCLTSAAVHFNFIPQHNHIYGEWQVTKKPTLSEYGERTCVCAVCSETKTEIIEKLIAQGDLTCQIIDGEVTITDCSESASGELVIPNTIEGYPVTEIGNYAFAYCKSLTNIEIPDSVTEIGIWAFSYCESLTNITIPAGVIEVGQGVFENCKSLTNIEIPDSVTEIGKDAFWGCESLTNITIPAGVTSIGNYAFYQCESLTKITIPAGVIHIGSNAFEGCTALAGITVDDNNEYYSSDTFGVLFNKDKTNLIQYPCGGETEYIIPDSVTRINDQAFASCTTLESIIIPDSITKIVSNMFEGCEALTNITIPDSVTKIETSAFEGCTALKSITIPDSVTEIGSHAFEGCTALTNITIPDSVIEIGFFAFEYCKSLTDITVDDNNEYYSSDAFGVLFNKDKTNLIQYPCGGETEYIIPDSVTEIGYYAFNGCESLTNITIPDSVTEIGIYAFNGCEALTNITIPDSVTEIGSHAFGYCKSLTDITVDDNNEYYSSDAFGVLFNKDKTNLIQYPCGGKTEYIIPAGVTVIETSAFEGCTALTNVIIPAGVTVIGLVAFNGCKSLTSITIPAGLTAIHNGAFAACPSLTDVYYSGTKAEWNNIIFNSGNDILNMITIHFNAVPPHNHIYGEWQVTKEPTFMEYGERTCVCADCGDIKTEIIEKLTAQNEIKAENTDISISFTDSAFGGDIQISAVQELDGEAFNILNMEKGNFASQLFDINITQDGNKIQPNTVVLVKIPLPEGYDAENTVVYHVTNDGKLEKIDSYCENGYICFETSHFSSFAIVDESHEIATEPPVTEPPVTEPPVTNPPVTEPPVTEPPVTNPPVTEPPVTNPPVTEPPVTNPPVSNPTLPDTSDVNKTPVFTDNRIIVKNGCVLVPPMSKTELDAVSSENYRINDSKGLPKTDGALVAGDTLICSGNSYKILVLFDADGNGKITSADARIILRCTLRLENVSDDIRFAVTADETRKPTSADARKALRIALRLDTI